MYPHIMNDSYIHYFNDYGALYTANGNCILSDIEVYMIEKFNGIKSIEDLTEEIAEEIKSDNKNRVREILYEFIHSKGEGISFGDQPKEHAVRAKGVKGLKLPLSLKVNLTNMCNLQCIHCFKSCSSHERDFIPSDKLRNALLYLKGKLDHIQLTGGEPMLHKNFFEILECSKANFRTTITTNGTLIHADNAVHFRGVNAVQISLYSNIPHNHDSITGVNGSFHKTLNGIKMLTKENIYCLTAAMITRSNLVNIEDIIKFNEDLGVKAVRFGKLVPSGRGCSLKEEWVLSSEELEKTKYILHDFSEKYKGRISVETWEEEQKGKSISRKYKALSCGAGLLSWTISETGVVKPCEYFPDDVCSLGSIIENEVEDIAKRSSCDTYPQQISDWHQKLQSEGGCLADACSIIDDYYREYCCSCI